MITVRQFKQLKFKSKKNPLEAEEIIGKNLFDAIKNNFYISNKNIVVLCGNTNKGHLGFVLARYFREDIIVDAILDNEVKGFIREPAKSAIIKYNNSKAFKIAIDYPSGLNPDTGIAVDIETKNNLIFTLQDMKKGLLQYKNVVVVDTGLK
ncbi:hypothetical protein HYX18_03615 [Candidatus Woesearchaeota archaeon]|nr:hypothetical protein [Candidatus Woesearchaeota archaeon]